MSALGCVEAATLQRYVAVRDAKNSNGPALVFTVEQWDAFIAGAAVGEFIAGRQRQSAVASWPQPPPAGPASASNPARPTSPDSWRGV